MDIPYLNSDNFQSPDSASATTLARELESLLKNDCQGDMFALLAGYQRTLAGCDPETGRIGRKLSMFLDESVDLAVYDYQLFGYFLLLNDAREHHRRAIRLDMWEAP